MRKKSSEGRGRVLRDQSLLNLFMSSSDEDSDDLFTPPFGNKSSVQKAHVEENTEEDIKNCSQDSFNAPLCSQDSLDSNDSSARETGNKKHSGNEEKGCSMSGPKPGKSVVKSKKRKEVGRQLSSQR